MIFTPAAILLALSPILAQQRKLIPNKPIINKVLLIIVSVRWNGTAVGNHDLIFHEDVPRFFPDSNLMCQSNTAGASWHYPNGTVVGPFGANSDDYVQIPDQTDVDLLRNKNSTEINPLNNGLWTCRLGDLFILVGIYLRGGDSIA